MAKTKAKMLQRLQRVLDEIPELGRLHWRDPAIRNWRVRADAAIEGAFGPSSQAAADFDDIGYPVASDKRPQGHLDDPLEVRDGLEKARSLIESLVVRIEERWPDDDEPALTPPAYTVGTPATNRTVFIAHGRDQGAKHALARLLEKVDLKPVILSDQPSQGKTIIEKFEASSKVSYAIALLTADDTGSRQGDDGRMRPRARQNVIFELGFFIGKLGRNRVCALTKGKPEIPSDYSGVVYIPMDEGDAWQSQLVKELKSAGFDVDANKLYD